MGALSSLYLQASPQAPAQPIHAIKGPPPVETENPNLSASQKSTPAPFTLGSSHGAVEEAEEEGIPLQAPFQVWAKASASFRVWEVPDVLTRRECSLLVEAIDAGRLWKPSEVQTEDGHIVHTTLRQSSTAWLSWRRSDAAGQAARKVLAAGARLSGLPDFEAAASSALQLVSYGCGQFYRVHTDSVVNRDGRPGGRGTLLVYLNDDFEGGKTHFPRLKKKVRPEAGKGVFWYTRIMADGGVDLMSAHEGTEVTAGTKRLCTLWFSI